MAGANLTDEERAALLAEVASWRAKAEKLEQEKLHPPLDHEHSHGSVRISPSGKHLKFASDDKFFRRLPRAVANEMWERTPEALRVKLLALSWTTATTIFLCVAHTAYSICAWLASSVAPWWAHVRR